MSDREEILDTVTRLFWFTDHHRWDELEGLFADEVELDYTSLQGGEPETLPPADIVDGWKRTLGPLDAHQHLIADQIVSAEGDGAELTAASQAVHQFKGETWTLGGDYRFLLTRADGGWRVESMTMTAVWQTGDRELVARAAGSRQ